MSHVVPIPIPVPYLGSVNLWLLKGDPLTLVDAGPANPVALAALEKGLAEHGYALADIELCSSRTITWITRGSPRRSGSAREQRWLHTAGRPSGAWGITSGRGPSIASAKR